MNPNIIGNRIKSIMIIEDIKRSYLAKKMNISYNTLTKKLNGEREFTLNEILKMKIILDLDMETCANLFFNEENFVYKEKKLLKNEA
ncbi:MAG: helix-turn-helix transcriptional regulator [Clostridia bacterium]|nr:helix-turn-helix transcriptional regulator [Clostridia bacterium]